MTTWTLASEINHLAFLFGLLCLLTSICDQQEVGGSRLHLNHGLDTPHFLDTVENNITVGPGDRAVLKCIVKNLGTKTVTWRKKTDSHPLTIGLFTFVGDTRISVDHNRRTDEWSLIIQDVNPGDEGHYECQISTKDDAVKSFETILNVKTVQVSGNDYVEQGSEIQLVCNATGKPDPPHDVEWFKDGQKIQSNAKSGVLITKKIEAKVLISVMVIRKSRMSDDGYYICRSSNRDFGMIKVHVLNEIYKNMQHRASDQGTSVQHVRGSNHQMSLHSSQGHTTLLFGCLLLIFLLSNRCCSWPVRTR